MCNFFGITYPPRFSHNPWVNGLIGNQNKRLDRLIRTSSQQNVIRLTDLAKFYTFALNTQILSNSILPPYETFFKEKHCVLIEFRLGMTRDHNQVFNSLFCKYSPTHSQNNISNQNPTVQPLLTKPLISYTLQLEKSIHYNHSSQYLTIKKRLLSKSKLKHRLSFCLIQLTPDIKTN